MSAPKELESLKNIRAKLEEESHALAEEQKTLEERVQILEEKIAIEEQKNRNREMREAIERLRMKINELEQRLKEVSRAYEPEEPPVETMSEAQITTQAIEQISEEEAGEEIVTSIAHRGTNS